MEDSCIIYFLFYQPVMMGFSYFSSLSNYYLVELMVLVLASNLNTGSSTTASVLNCTRICWKFFLLYPTCTYRLTSSMFLFCISNFLSPSLMAASISLTQRNCSFLTILMKSSQQAMTIILSLPQVYLQVLDSLSTRECSLLHLSCISLMACWAFLKVGLLGCGVSWYCEIVGVAFVFSWWCYGQYRLMASFSYLASCRIPPPFWIYILTVKYIIIHAHLQMPSYL